MQECPRCRTCELKIPIESNALSSRDEKTWICSDCGQDEANVNFMISKGKESIIPFQSIAKEKYFCKKLGVKCPVA